MNSKENFSASKVAELPGNDGGMEKVRELLFGQQLREFTHRIECLGQELSEKVEMLRSDSSAELSELALKATKVQSEIQAALESEVTERSALADSTTSALDNLAGELGRRIEGLEASFTEQINELGSALGRRIEDLETELDVQLAKLSKAVDSEVEKLEQGKLDRTALASMFSKMSEQLNENR
ncbi:MAG: hypothetical protein ABW162_05485 [Candidatus Sedimenticola sp. PURPLELP]